MSRVIVTVTASLTLAMAAPAALGQPQPPDAATGAADGTQPAEPAEPTEGAPTPAPPVTPDPATADPDDGAATAPVFTARLYGYIDAHYEKSAAVPSRIEDGQTVFDKQPGEWDVANFNVMIQGNVFGKYRYFLNLASPGSGSPGEDAVVGVRNAWVELPIYRDLFNLRAGKLYRRFGLYNESLDAVPTFIGIEPPEMFDSDHLMLTRTTNAMLHGKVTSQDTTLSYALSTGNDERESSEIPLGADLRFDFPPGVQIGASYYATNGNAAPSVSFEDGKSPIGGVAHWMARDDFKVYSVFAQLITAGVTLQVEYTAAQHEAERDPDKVATLAQEAGLSEPQLARFFIDPADPMAGNVRQDVSYQVRAAYVRVGYEIKVAGWQLVPYGQFDYYSNTENIDSEDYGGDHEAGLADNGVFYKSTLGLVVRPARFVALKVDGSTHTHLFNGTYETYPEVRTSLSLYWEFGDAQ